jgi:hydroxylamine reductase
MLPANYYPAFKKFKHFHGNYGSSWWHQLEDFENFNGAILMTTNCIVPLRKENTYLDRMFTTGMAGYPGAMHIADRKEQSKIQSLDRARTEMSCSKEIETARSWWIAHATVLSLADKVLMPSNPGRSSFRGDGSCGWPHAVP